MTDTHKKKVYLNVSDIAAYIGQNKFDYVTPFERLWKRCDKESLATLLEECTKKVQAEKNLVESLKENQKGLLVDLQNEKITQRQFTLRNNKIQKQIHAALESSKTVEQRVDEISLTNRQKLEKAIGSELVEKLAGDTLSTQTKRIDFNKTLENSSLSATQKESLYKTGESFINTTHGTLREDDAIKMYEDKTGVRLNTSQELFKKTFKVDDEYEWIICGKIDGICKNENSEKNYLVEVKNRTKAFFSNVRDYEKTQIHLYMWMIEYTRAKLVEKKGNTIRITEINVCGDYTQLIFDRLGFFITKFKEFLENEAHKLEYISKCPEEKKMFLECLYLNEISTLGPAP
jgi:hypothetical protein